MRPQRDSSLVDLLDRLIDKGLILNADLMITVAGVPLIGLSLRAVLASMETMLDYGMMEDWDLRVRSDHRRADHRVRFDRSMAKPHLRGEEVLVETRGYLWSNDGVIQSWRAGTWFVTGTRVLLMAGDGTDDPFEVPISEVVGMVENQVGPGGLCIRLRGGDVRIRLDDPGGFCRAVECAAEKNGLSTVGRASEDVLQPDVLRPVD